jgi:hypothetical protein
MMRKSVFLSALTMAVWVASSAAPAQSVEEKLMAQRIAAELKQSGQLKNYRVGVKYSDGVAWLEGTVTSESQRRTAVQLSRQLEGVDHVVSKLEIEPAEPVTVSTRTAPQTGQSLQLAAVASNHPPVQRPPAEQLLARGQGRLAERRRAFPGRTNMPLPARRVYQGQPAVRSQPVTEPHGRADRAQYCEGDGMDGGPAAMGPVPGGTAGGTGGGTSYDQAQMPAYAWPSYASYPNYGALTYPRQYSPTAWPYIGPFYPYPQVPLGWRKVSLEWDDGWWFLDFNDCATH